MLLNYAQGQFYTYPYPSVWLTSEICWLPLHLTYCVCEGMCMFCLYVLYVCMYVCIYVCMCVCIHVTYPHARAHRSINLSVFFVVGVKLSYVPER